MRAPAAVTGALIGLTLLTACGDQGSDPDAASGGWRTERLEGRTAVDQPTVLTAAGDDALVLMLSDGGVLQSHLSVDGGAFEAGEPLDTGERRVALGGAVRLDDGSWYALGSGGTRVVDGDEEGTHAPVAFRSGDGLVWERVEVSGFADALDVHDLLVTDDGTVVASGSYRTARDPDQGGFEAHVWTSPDGEAFDEVDLPGVPPYRGWDDESYVGDLAAVDGALLAGGRVDERAALWRSADGGATWEHEGDPLLRDAYAITGLAVVGGSAVASTAGLPTQAVRSTDGGRTWQAVDLPVGEEADGWAPLWSGGGRFFTLTGLDDTTWSRPEVCYADPEQCGREVGPTLVSSSDGSSWTGVDTEDLGELDQVVGTADGRVLVMAGDEGGTAVEVHTWPAGTGLPVAEQPAVPETVELVEVPEGEEPEPGVRYHAPLYTHCGVEWLFFADRSWRRTDGGPAFGEDQGMVYGYATVGEDGVLEYSLATGEVVATYEERGRAPGCR